jgi:hypothetical protein
MRSYPPYRKKGPFRPIGLFSDCLGGLMADSGPCGKRYRYVPPQHTHRFAKDPACTNRMTLLSTGIPIMADAELRPLAEER